MKLLLSILMLLIFFFFKIFLNVCFSAFVSALTVMTHPVPVDISKVSMMIEIRRLIPLCSTPLLSILMMTRCLISALQSLLYYHVRSICPYLNSLIMPNFSIKFQFKKDDVHRYKTAIVRASSIEAAKEKLADFSLKVNGPVDDFKIEKVSLSNYDYCII